MSLGRKAGHPGMWGQILSWQLAQSGLSLEGNLANAEDELELGEAGDWGIYCNYLILSLAAITTTFYGASVICQAEHLHSFRVSSLTPAL